MEAEQVPSVVVPVEGSTRQNFTVDERTTGTQFRFVLEGAQLSESEWNTCLQLVGRLTAAGSAASMIPATERCHRLDVERLEEELAVTAPEQEV